MKTKNKRRTWSIFIFVVIAPVISTSLSVAAPEPAEYPDVPDKHWAASSVTALSRNGLVEGYSDGTFQGDKPMTRYEFAVSQARINHEYWATMDNVAALNNQVNQIMKRLASLENRFKIVEEELNATNTPAGLATALTRASQSTDFSKDNAIQPLCNDLKDVTQETLHLLKHVKIR